MDTTELTLEQKEKNIDIFLCYLKKVLENIGSNVEQYQFDFRQKDPFFDDEDNGYHYNNFIQLNLLTKEDVQKTIKICLTNEYIKGSPFVFKLTRQGFARANSVEKSVLYKSNDTNNNFNFNGPVSLNNSQIGNNNQLCFNIDTSLENLLNFVETTQASQQDKNDAKNILRKFIEHPIVSSAISTTIDTLIKTYFGG